jgi:hypothetical protein
MANELGISFSPFGQPNQQDQQGPSGRGASPQDAIRVLSFRPPRTVGANAPVASQLLNARGGAGFGGSPLGGFGPAGNDLEQLLALLYGLRKPMQPGGSGSFNERPPQGDLSALFGGNAGGQLSQPPPADEPLPWLRSSAPPPKTTFNEPGAGDEYKGSPPETLGPRPGQTVYSPPSARPLPWEPSPIERGDRFRI